MSAYVFNNMKVGNLMVRDAGSGVDLGLSQENVPGVQGVVSVNLNLAYTSPQSVPIDPRKNYKVTIEEV